MGHDQRLRRSTDRKACSPGGSSGVPSGQAGSGAALILRWSSPLATAAYVPRASTSAGVSIGLIPAEALLGLGGEHIYLIIVDGADFSRALPGLSVFTSGAGLAGPWLDDGLGLAANCLSA